MKQTIGNRTIIVGAAFLWGISLHPAAGQVLGGEALSPRNANYSIDVALDVRAKVLTGRQTLSWRNITNERIAELRFHLYLNAFRNSESTFMKESGGTSRGLSASGDWGWIELDSMRHPGGTDLLARARFVAPDDGNEHDRTVLAVPLPSPVGPGETIDIDMTFRAKLPRVFARTGYAGQFFMVAQWFPKIGVYEPAGMRGRVASGWNCHQFHANTEFYADYGVYDVAMTVPNGYVLGASGVLRSATPSGDTSTTYRYRAEDVHDFAWTCSPDYVVIEDRWKHVAIRLLIQPEHIASKQERYLHSVKGSLEYFDRWLGVYPYTSLTIVDPPLYGFGAGGMEYPTLITGGSVRYLPSGVREVETVTVHEFGHQYWYGLVGNNEFEEAWLDEGLNQYSESLIMDHLYGAGRSFVDVYGYTQGSTESNRSGYLSMDHGKIAPISTPAWEFTIGGYGGITYAKTANVLKTLEGIIGRAAMDDVMRTFYERWRFRHPAKADFVAVVSEVVRNHHGGRFGPDMQWFFEQTIDGTNSCDYELKEIDVREVRPPRGIGFGRADTGREVRYESTIDVYRRGEVTLPVDVLVVFDDGDSLRVAWDGTARSLRIREVRGSRAVFAAVDPERKIVLDENVLNNARSVSTGRAAVWKYTMKFLFWLQNVAQAASIF